MDIHIHTYLSFDLLFLIIYLFIIETLGNHSADDTLIQIIKVMSCEEFRSNRLFLELIYGSGTLSKIGAFIGMYIIRW